MSQVSEKSFVQWQRLVDTHSAFLKASHDFLSNKDENIEALRQALHGKDRYTALSIVQSLGQEDQIKLFSELVDLGRCAHSFFEAAWRIILALPREWVLANIEREVDQILCKEEEHDYWMFLQLYEKLDPALAERLAQRAIAHPNPEIQEHGRDTLDRLRS